MLMRNIAAGSLVRHVPDRAHVLLRFDDRQLCGRCVAERVPWGRVKLLLVARYEERVARCDHCGWKVAGVVHATHAIGERAPRTRPKPPV